MADFVVKSRARGVVTERLEPDDERRRIVEHVSGSQPCAPPASGTSTEYRRLVFNHVIAKSFDCSNQTGTDTFNTPDQLAFEINLGRLRAITTANINEI